MPENIISFPNPGDSGYTDGITCGIYSWGWISDGCTDENGNYRGFTNEWYYDDSVGAWVSITEDSLPDGNDGSFLIVGDPGYTLTNLISITSDRVIFNNDISHKINNAGYESLTVDTTKTISFLESNIYYLIFDIDGSGGITLELMDPPPPNYYSEMKIILKNPSYPDFLVITGKDYENNDSVVVMDGPTVDSYSTGTYMWTAWTIDGGQKYYLYRTNGFGRYWND
jgi:hypothetical protein